MNEMQVFQNSEFGELGVLEIEGKPYFPAKAAAKMLGYKDTINAMAALLDQATGSDFARDAVCMFFIANEGLSVLENTAVMGVPYPAFVKNMLDALHQTGDQGKGTEART